MSHCLDNYVGPFGGVERIHLDSVGVARGLQRDSRAALIVQGYVRLHLCGKSKRSLVPGRLRGECGELPTGAGKIDQIVKPSRRNIFEEDIDLTGWAES